MDLPDKVFDLCKGLKNGFFIDSGANDGLAQSNTYRLEKSLGWKGILIDASQPAMNLCWNNRSHENVFITKALGDEEGRLVAGDFAGDLRGKIGGSQYGQSSVVEMVTLTSILKQYGITKVDFWSLDIEGFELGALKGLDWNYCSPRMLVIEVWPDTKGDIFSFMDSKGYRNPLELSEWTLEKNPTWSGNQDYLFTKG